MRCVASTEVPSIAKVTNMVDFIDLSLGAKEWSNKILTLYSSKNIRKSHIKEVRDAGYDIKIEVIKLENYYIELSK